MSEATTVERPWADEVEPNPLRVLAHHHELVRSLVLRDIRSRYKQSVLGIAWVLLQPLAMTAVFTIVMSHIARVNTGGIPYPIFVYIAMLPWTFFAGGLTSSAECLVANFNLITKVYFPREAFPIAAVLGKGVDLAMGVLVLVPLFIIYKVHVTPMILLVLPVLLIQTCLLLGLAFLMSSLNLFFRDVRHAMPLFTQVWMYLTPVVYPLSLVPDRYKALYMLNPMVAIMETYRRVALLGEPPVWGYLWISAIVSVAILVMGYLVFKRLEPLFAETI